MNRVRLPVLGVVTLGVLTAGAVWMFLLAVVTLGRARNVRARAAVRIARLVLAIWGVRVRRHGRSWPAGQVVYISNHPSTLDVFILTAIGLPRTRFFLSGFLRRYGPFGAIAWLLGSFFTVPQDRPDERRRIFAAACETLRRTGESVYLSPEGRRVTGGHVGPFNKGAFHLAAALAAPVVPIGLVLSPETDPGLGYDVRPGVVDVFAGDPIDTRGWRTEDAASHRDRVHAWFTEWHQRIVEVSRADSRHPGTTSTTPAHEGPHDRDDRDDRHDRHDRHAGRGLARRAAPPARVGRA